MCRAKNKLSEPSKLWFTCICGCCTSTGFFSGIMLMPFHVLFMYSCNMCTQAHRIWPFQNILWCPQDRSGVCMCLFERQAVFLLDDDALHSPWLNILMHNYIWIYTNTHRHICLLANTCPSFIDVLRKVYGHTHLDANTASFTWNISGQIYLA